MKKTWIRLVSLIIVTLLLMTGLAVAEETKSAEVVFSAVEKENDIVQLTLTVKNTTFMGMQTALKYNTDVIEPVDESGKKVTDFAEFAKKHEDAKCFSTVGVKLDSDNGYFGFTYYIMPGAEDDKINDAGEYVADESGITLCEFRFKRIAEGDCGFAIVSKKDADFSAAVEPGIYIMDYTTGALSANISFEYEDKESEKIVLNPMPPAPAEPELTSSERKKDVICLQIGKAMTVSMGKKTLIDANNRQVVPYITNDRTMVPARFVAETLGAEVLWEEGWGYCIIKKDDKEIKLNFNSAEFEVNGEKVTFDAPVEITQDRTMVPLRFVSEQLDCDVYWNERNQAVVISPTDNPWQEKRGAEITALNEMLVTITGLLP